MDNSIDTYKEIKDTLDNQIESSYKTNHPSKTLAKELVRFLIQEVFVSEQDMKTLTFEAAPYRSEIQGCGNEAIIKMIEFWAREITADFIHVKGNFFYLKGEVIP